MRKLRHSEGSSYRKHVVATEMIWIQDRSGSGFQCHVSQYITMHKRKHIISAKKRNATRQILNQFLHGVHGKKYVTILMTSETTGKLSCKNVWHFPNFPIRGLDLSQQINPKNIPNSNNYMKTSTHVCRNDV